MNELLRLLAIPIVVTIFVAIGIGWIVARKTRAAGIITAAIILLIGGLIVFGPYKQRIIAEVPELMDLNQVEAERVTQREELALRVAELRYSDKEKGTVISQEPETGRYLRKKSWVEVVVSKGLPQVPGVVGLSKEDAETKISEDEEAKFSTTIKEQYDNNILANIVISQTPEANTFAAVGSKVKLAISKGRPVIPDMVGKSKEDAKSVIESDENAGFVFSSTEQYHNTISKADVISQNPQAGTQVLIGSAVNVVVSKGQPVVPTVVGKSKTEAQSLIKTDKEAGFSFVATEEYSKTVPKGNAISQNPMGGTAVPIGTVVRVVVSKGQRPPVYHSCTGCPCPRGYHGCTYCPWHGPGACLP